MRFHIRKVILWPRKTEFQPRVVEFTGGAVNVISGASKTGKTAIIPIIDYCLCSRECKIPVDLIRNACSWFGVVVDTDHGQKLFCRREPKQQKITDDMYFAEAPGDIEIPRSIENHNQSASKVRRILDDFAGLTNLDFDADDTGSGFKGRPSFGDMKAFCFQPQNIVANPDVLFFKADTFDHREKLKTIFPYVLNAVTPQTLAAQHEYAAVRKELLRKARDLDLLRSASSNWIAELHSWITEARDVGLIPGAVTHDNTASGMIALLRDVAHQSTSSSPTSIGIGEVVSEIVDLQREESQASIELGSLRRRFAEMSKLKESADQYSGAMEIQRDRLSISAWLRSLKSDDLNCPMCHSLLDAENKELTHLCKTLEVLEQEASVSRTIPASFDRELDRVRNEIEVITEKLKGIRLRLDSAESRSEEARQNRYRSDRAARLMGRIEQSLRIHDEATDDGDLAAEVAELQRRMKALAKQFSEADIRKKIDNALQRITALAALIIPTLDAENVRDPIILQLNDLTIKVISKERENFLRYC